MSFPLASAERGDLPDSSSRQSAGNTGLRGHPEVSQLYYVSRFPVMVSSQIEVGCLDHDSISDRRPRDLA